MAVSANALETISARAEQPSGADVPGERPVKTRRGPLLAVCGAVGGAGASTLTYLTALAAAQQLDQPVLVADTGGSGVTLSAYAGIETPHSLAGLAAALSVRSPLTSGVYAAGPAGLRIIASVPEFSLTCARCHLQRLLEDAREAHGLTVIDCGTLAREVDRIAAMAATHLAWVIPATRHGIRRGGRLLNTAPHMADRELLIARGELRASKATLRELRGLASHRGARLILLPHLQALETDWMERALEQGQVAIQAILGALRR